MNLTEFVDQIDVRLEDVLYQKIHGCTLGLTNILTKQLKYIDRWKDQYTVVMRKNYTFI